MDHLRGFKDCTAADWVPAVFDGATPYKIDRSPNNGRKLILHMNMVEQTPPRIWCKCCQEIDVAVGTKIVAQDRPENGKL